jgi:alcohol dehydrogenase
MNERTKIMKALVYHVPGKRAWEEVPDAVIQEITDAVVPRS